MTVCTLIKPAQNGWIKSWKHTKYIPFNFQSKRNPQKSEYELQTRLRSWRDFIEQRWAKHRAFTSRDSRAANENHLIEPSRIIKWLQTNTHASKMAKIIIQILLTIAPPLENGRSDVWAFRYLCNSSNWTKLATKRHLKLKIEYYWQSYWDTSSTERKFNWSQWQRTWATHIKANGKWHKPSTYKAHTSSIAQPSSTQTRHHRVVQIKRGAVQICCYIM